MLAGRDILLDAGPIIALLDPRDQWHAAASRAAPGMLQRCFTTEPVVVEATHFVARSRSDHTSVLMLLTSLDIPILALHRPMHLLCIELMRRYAAVPMDYADATLVAAAEKLQIRQVFTFDQRGFRQYRAGAGRAPLAIIPNTGPKDSRT